MCKEIARIQIRIQGLPGSGLRFFAGSGFDVYGSETLMLGIRIICIGS